jgi:hypothetical protein
MLLVLLVLRELPRTRTRLRERRGFHGGSHHVGDGSAHNNASSNDHTSKTASTQACTEEQSARTPRRARCGRHLALCAYRWGILRQHRRDNITEAHT